MKVVMEHCDVGEWSLVMTGVMEHFDESGHGSLH